MQLNNNFHNIFGKKPIIGMLHLAGSNPLQRALEELDIYEEEGASGVIVENYCGNEEDVKDVLKEFSNLETNLALGVNVLSNEYDLAFPWANAAGFDFIQLDHVAGNYRGHREVDAEDYEKFKREFPEIVVLGGVWPKYYTPIESSNLEEDIKKGMQRAEAMVVTGTGTGQPTPTAKVERFRELLVEHPLIVGAGLNPRNAYGQLAMADGAIVGSYFKNGSELEKIDRYKVREITDIARELRE
jgi:uncharacterized protein